MRINTNIYEGGPSVNHFLYFDVSSEELELLRSKGLVDIRLTIAGRPDVVCRRIEKELGHPVDRYY